jgi:hypothetical protein
MVTVLVATQADALDVNEMTVTPGAVPRTTPDVLIVAAAELLLLHTPP